MHSDCIVMVVSRSEGQGNEGLGSFWPAAKCWARSCVWVHESDEGGELDREVDRLQQGKVLSRLSSTIED